MRYLLDWLLRREPKQKEHKMEVAELQVRSDATLRRVDRLKRTYGASDAYFRQRNR